MMTWRTRGVLLGIIVLACILRLFRLDYLDYWDDEIITTFAIQPNLGQIFQNISSYSVHPPMYYLLLHGWAWVFGDSLLSLRLFSVLIGVVAVPLVYLLGRTLISSQVGLGAAAMLAIAPMVIFHSQQARMYPLLIILTLIVAVGFWRAWQQRDWRGWLLVGLGALLGFYTHIYFALSLLAMNLWAVGETIRSRAIDRQGWTGLLSSQIIATLLFLPFLSRTNPCNAIKSKGCSPSMANKPKIINLATQKNKMSYPVTKTLVG